MRGHTKSLDANDKLIQTRSHVRNAIASRERQVVMRKVKSTIAPFIVLAQIRFSQLKQFSETNVTSYAYQQISDLQTFPECIRGLLKPLWRATCGPWAYGWTIQPKITEKYSEKRKKTKEFTENQQNTKLEIQAKRGQVFWFNLPGAIRPSAFSSITLLVAICWVIFL